MVFTCIFSISKSLAEPLSSPPSVNSETAILMESNSGKVLYAKDAGKEMYPASLTKIATAIYAIDKGRLDETVNVSKEAKSIEGTRVYLEEGEQVTLKKLLQGLLINSGNDAGVAIAQQLSGSVDQFASDLNQYLKNEIGVKGTNFANPHGLYNPNHVSSAKDLAKITQYAMKNQAFRKLFGTKMLNWDGESWDSTLYTHHKLMRQDPYKGISGGKTGYVDESGFTLATTAKRNNVSLIVITMNSERQSIAYEDTKKLLDYGFNNFKTSTLRKGETFYSEDIEYILPETLNVTLPKKAQLRYELSNTGDLKIVNKEGDVQETFPLEKVDINKNEVKKASLPSGEKEKMEKKTLTTFSITFVILSILVGLCFILYKNT